MCLMAGCAGATSTPEIMQAQKAEVTTEAVETVPAVKLELKDLEVIEIGGKEANLEQPNLSDLCYMLDNVLGFVSSSSHTDMGSGESVVCTYRPNTMEDPYNYPPSIVIASQTEHDFKYAVRLYYRAEGRDKLELKRPNGLTDTRVLSGLITGITPDALRTVRGQLVELGWQDKDGVLEGSYTSESGEYWVVDICADDEVSYITWYNVEEANASIDVDMLRTGLDGADEQA